jgi:hypothetical protein
MPPKKKEISDKKMPLGKYAFPKIRSPKFQVPDEENTELENRLEYALDIHFNDNEGFGEKNTKDIQSILKSKKYQDILITPMYDEVYRGMAVTKEWAEKVIGKEIRKYAETEINFIYKPKEGSSSWTGSIGTAEYFARERADNEHCYLAVLYAKTYDNPNKFLAGRDGIYRLKDYEKFYSENECVGLGPIKVFKIKLNLY